MIRELDHIGIAVPSLSDGIRTYVEVLGFTHLGTEEVASEKVIEGYEGPAGKLWCRTWGSRQGFMESVSSRSGFKYEKAPKPKGLKPLDLPDVK